MGLDVPALFAREVLQTPPCGIERLVDRHPSMAMDRLDLCVLVMCVAFDVLQYAVQ